MKTLSSSDRDKIIRLIRALVPQGRIYLFGSRARGTNSPVSDVDIAIDAGKALPRRVVGEIVSVMSASDLIYHVDVVDIHDVSDVMKGFIREEGIVWAE